MKRKGEKEGVVEDEKRGLREGNKEGKEIKKERKDRRDELEELRRGEERRGEERIRGGNS